MRFIRKAMIGLAALAALPLAAQGPLPAPTAKKVETAAATAPAAQTKPVTLDAADLEAWMDGYLPYALERARIPGAVVVVVKDGQVVLQKGYGFADVAKRAPVLPETTMFRPGSVSKLLTWTAVMQQVEAGKIDLDKDVNAYLDFKIPPYQGKPVTMRNIMTHTAGFEESVRHLISSDPKAVMTLKQQMPLALPERVFAPGTTPAYSNYATALAGYIVERVSGEPFDTYIENHIFTPLGMTHSTFRQPLPARLAPHMAKGYPDVTQKAKPFEIVIPGPAGSLSASGADMGKFMIAHLNDGAGLLKPETAKMMHDFKAPGVGPLNSMALGFYEQWVNGQRAIAHGGDTVWFHSYLWLFPEDDIGVYVSMNSAGTAGRRGRDPQRAVPQIRRSLPSRRRQGGNRRRQDRCPTCADDGRQLCQQPRVVHQLHEPARAVGAGDHLADRRWQDHVPGARRPRRRRARLGRGRTLRVARPRHRRTPRRRGQGWPRRALQRRCGFALHGVRTRPGQRQCRLAQPGADRGARHRAARRAGVAGARTGAAQLQGRLRRSRASRGARTACRGSLPGWCSRRWPDGSG